MSLAGQATSPLGKSCGVESMGTGGRGEDIAFEDTALLKLAFFLLFFNVGEFHISKNSSVGTVLCTPKVSFPFLHPPPAPEDPSLQEDISM